MKCGFPSASKKKLFFYAISPRNLGFCSAHESSHPMIFSDILFTLNSLFRTQQQQLSDVYERFIKVQKKSLYLFFFFSRLKLAASKWQIYVVSSVLVHIFLGERSVITFKFSFSSFFLSAALDSEVFKVEVHHTRLSDDFEAPKTDETESMLKFTSFLHLWAYNFQSFSVSFVSHRRLLVSVHGKKTKRKATVLAVLQLFKMKFMRHSDLRESHNNTKSRVVRESNTQFFKSTRCVLISKARGLSSSPTLQTHQTQIGEVEASTRDMRWKGFHCYTFFFLSSQTPSPIHSAKSMISHKLPAAALE